MNPYPEALQPAVQDTWDGLSDAIVTHAEVLHAIFDAIGPLYQY